MDEQTPHTTNLKCSPADFRSGFVAVVGRPNVGKSSLVNAFLGQKINIVSPRPQTTRNRLLGILTLDRAQVVFFDTPGIHKPLHKLGEMMVEAATRAIRDADVVLFVADANVEPQPEDLLVANAMRRRGDALPVILALNKIDLLPPGTSLNPEPYLSVAHPTAWVPVSAARGDGQDRLLDLIVDLLPEGPLYYPEDAVTDQQTRFIVAELIREAALNRLRDEVPHSLAVVVNEYIERSADMVYINATVFVERSSHKGIVIGQRGQMLRTIGQAARGEIEGLLESRVYLELSVKLRENWRKKSDDIRRLGYGLED